MPRKPVGLVLGAIFGVLALIDVAQVILALLGLADNPATVVALTCGTGATAAATCWGSWHRSSWTPIAAVAYGALATTLLLAIPSLLHLPSDARTGLRGGAAAVLLFALVSAAYFRAAARQSAAQTTTKLANEG